MQPSVHYRFKPRVPILDQISLG